MTDDLTEVPLGTYDGVKPSNYKALYYVYVNGRTRWQHYAQYRAIQEPSVHGPFMTYDGTAYAWAQGYGPTIVAARDAAMTLASNAQALIELFPHG